MVRLDKIFCSKSLRKFKNFYVCICRVGTFSDEQVSCRNRAEEFLNPNTAYENKEMNWMRILFFLLRNMRLHSCSFELPRFSSFECTTNKEIIFTC